jgi:carbonic anhydrase
MSTVLSEVLTANKQFADSFGDKGSLALPPAHQFAVLTCMPTRIAPATLAGLSEGDAHVVPKAAAERRRDSFTCYQL